MAVRANHEDDLVARVRARLSHPASTRELVQLLAVPREQRVAFRRQLKRAVADGQLVLVRGHRYAVPEQVNLVVGRLSTRPGGFGFVAPDQPSAERADVFIGANGLSDALHGDRVKVRVERVRDNRPEGRVVEVLARGASTIVGRFEQVPGGGGVILPFDQRLLAVVTVPRGEAQGARDGEMVVAEITRWPAGSRRPSGRVTEVLGSENAAGVDTRVIIRKFGLPDQHGDAALSEARQLTGGAPQPRLADARPADVAGRTDFRELTVVTIDGEHARDFDDAISVERMANGHYRLGVHIADVAHYVAEGSALDEEAFDRGTSVYFPERALHMFPELLATGLCSLNPGVDRLVQSCLMEVDGRGEVVGREFHDGVIRCRARMTYTDVNAILTGASEAARQEHAELVPLFVTMRDLFVLLNERRRRGGSIDFDLEEPEIVLDDEGMVEAITASPRNVAHRIVEEFMLLANQTVARFLEASSSPALYRNHEPPDPLKVAKFVEFVAGLGHAMPVPAHGVRPHHFQALISKLQGLPEERPVAYLMLRTMQKARYDAVNLGHFGLAFDCYTHFTSPIRRYPDLVVHRLLRQARSGWRDEAARGAVEAALPEAARHCSERERRAEQAERELVEWKKVRFMADRIGDQFDGYVTGVAAFGLFVELEQHYVEGLVHVTTMADDHYRFQEESHSLRGVDGGKVYQLGDRVRVQVINVDLAHRQVGLGLVEILEAVAGRRKHRGGRADRGAPSPVRRGRGVGRRPRPRRS